jgi:hypothetical protein
MAACGSKKNNARNNTVTVQGSRATAAVATPTPTPQQLLDRAAAATDALKAFHFTLNHENGTTPIAQGISMRKAEGDFVKPDRFKGTIDGTLGGGLTITAKVIGIGSNTWISTIGDRYVSLQNGIGAAAILDPQNGVLKAVRSVKSPQLVGSERLNGVDTSIVSGTVDAGDLQALDSAAQPGKPVTGRVWIASSDGRIQRIRLEGPLNDQEPANIARIIELSRFDQTVDIQPPP